MANDEVFDRGIRLQQLRKKAGLTQKQLADKLDVHESTISNYENNTQLPPIHTFEYFADLYSVSIDYLNGRESGEVIYLKGYSKRDQRILKSLAEELEKADD